MHHKVALKASSVAFAVTLALLPLAQAMAAELGRYAPQNIERSYRVLGWLCIVRLTCPVTDQVRNVIARAVAGKPDAEYLLGLTLITGDGLPHDETAAIAWTARAAEHGDPDAARDIADRLHGGASIDVDETKIFAALKPKADAGDLEAMRALGPMYIRGRGVKQDRVFGLELMKRAVEKGSTGAAMDLFKLYLLGAPGVPADRHEALRWITVSANNLNTEAMVTLGYMSMTTPFPVPSSARDVAQGFCWLMRAALVDQPQAQEKLSMMFASGEKDDRGTTIPIDLVQADLWFRLAARSPFHDNPQIRAMIEPKMTTAQLDEAKRLVAAWRPRQLQELKTIAIALPAATPNGAPRHCPALPGSGPQKP